MGIKITDKPKQTLYVYCRVSTTSQSEEGVSLDVQEERGLKFSKQINLSPIVIKEQGSGMKPFREVRPLFTELFDGISDGRVKNVWIDEGTRLTRYDIDQTFIHLEMKQQKVNLYEGMTSSPKKWDFITDLVDTIITKVNQNQIQKQVRKSIRSKRKLFQDGYYMKGDPPFGYKLVNKRLELHEEHSEWVKKIYEWYDDGKSTVWIRRELFNNEVPPPRGENGDWFPLQTINNILRNKNYIGIDVYGDLTNSCPPIIEKDHFRSVGKKLKTKSGRSIETKHDFLLRGIIKCSDGTPMSCLGQKKSRKNPLYSCGHKQRKYKNRKVDFDCPIIRSLRTELMDEYVWDKLVYTLSQSHIIKETTKKEMIGKNSSYTKRSFNNKLKKLNKKMVELDDNRLELEKRFYTNQIDKKRFDILINSIEDTENDLMSEIQSNQMKLDSLDYKSKWVNWLDVHFSRMDEIREITNFEKKRGIIHHYIHEIIVLDYNEETKQHTLSIKFRFPLYDDEFEWLKNKDGSYKLDRYGRRRYNIQDGETEMTNPFTLQYLLNRHTVFIGGWKPFISFDFILTTHQFIPHQYFTDYPNRKPLQEKVKDLHEKGWGYTKIHTYLIEKGFQIGESRTTVHTMLKKMKKRKEFLNQSIIEGDFTDFRLSVFKE
jgi:DNA invertase Pin-like site-specific DNA recombinase